MLGLFFAAVFILLNGFFVAAEFALVKVSTTLANTKKVPREDPRIARTRKVVSRIDRYLSVTQLGITLASLGLGWIGEPALERIFDDAARKVLGGEPGRVVHVIVIAVAFTILTFGHVLFGELVPKLVAIQRSDKVAHGSSGLLHIIYVVFQPLLWVLEGATQLILRAMGLRADAASEGTLSEDELVGILAANAARTPEGKSRADLFERVAKFANRTARHVMVPRVDVFMLPVSTTGADAIKQLRQSHYSRVILTKEKSVDEVAGYLYAKDFLLDPAAANLPTLESVRRELLFVPETQSLLEVMRGMQRSQVPIAVVVDEYGGTSGIVTMEDLLEEIVGEIRDELDVEAARVVKVGDDTWDVDARATMEDLRSVGVDVEASQAAEAVGAVVLANLGHIPRVGDKVALGTDATAEITSMSRRRVIRVRLRVTKAPESNPESRR